MLHLISVFVNLAYRGHVFNSVFSVYEIIQADFKKMISFLIFNALLGFLTAFIKSLPKFAAIVNW